MNKRIVQIIYSHHFRLGHKNESVIKCHNLGCNGCTDIVEVRPDVYDVTIKEHGREQVIRIYNPHETLSSDRYEIW